MKDVFEVLMYAFAIYGAAKFTLSCVDVIFNRNTKEGTPSASHNSRVMPCEMHSCCNCANVSCPLNGVNCSKFIGRTA